MTLTWKCGHKATVPDDVKEPPRCPACQERIVARVQAPPPRFTGSCRGPLVSP